jgi:hypothetical protein
MSLLCKPFQSSNNPLENPAPQVNNDRVRGLVRKTGKCMMRKIKGAVGGLILICATLLALGFGAVAQSQGQQVFDLGTVLNGSPPSSSAPWVTATFTTLFPGTVTLTLASHLTVTSEFISEIGLNLEPGLSPATLIFSQNSGPSNPAYSSVTQPAAQDTLALSGGGSQGAGFDLLIDWPNGNKPQRFDADDVVTLTITGPATLVAEDFLYYNTVGSQAGPVLIGAHVQGIPAAGGLTTSSAIMQTIPEPTTAALLLAGFALFALATKSKGTTKNSKNPKGSRI